MDITKNNLEELEHLNAQFMKSLRYVIEPFLEKVEKILAIKGMELNNDELKKVRESIDVIKIYASKEAVMLKKLNVKSEKAIIADINASLAIVVKIANDAEKGNFDELSSHCKELQADLFKLEEDIVSLKRAA